MSRFVTRLFGTPAPTATHRARRLSLSMESLETRDAPSAGMVGHILVSGMQSIMHSNQAYISAQISHHHLPSLASLLHHS